MVSVSPRETPSKNLPMAQFSEALIPKWLYCIAMENFPIWERPHSTCVGILEEQPDASEYD